MNLCNNQHDEICYEGRTCPLCQTVKEKDEEIESLTEKVDDLKQQLDSALEEKQ